VVDTTKPTLTQLGLPGTVNLSGGGQRASDNLSGLERAHISFDKSFRASEGFRRAVSPVHRFSRQLQRSIE
jgi:hypothetical protein